MMRTVETDRSDDAPRRRDAARDLVCRSRLRESLHLAPQPSLRNSLLAGGQAAITAGIALPLVHLSSRPELIGFAALGAMVALFGRFAPPGERNRIVLLCSFCQILAVLGMSAAVAAGASFPLQMLLLALACGGYLFVTTVTGIGAPGPLIFIFAAGASMSRAPLTFENGVARACATAAVAALALLICALLERQRHPLPRNPFPDPSFIRIGEHVGAACRTSVAAGAAIIVCHQTGATHPAWGAMGALAVMQGAHLHVRLHRALQRMAGTLIGALLAWALLSQQPSTWFLIGLIMLLQIATEVTIGVNYVFGQIFVTPMALLMTELAATNGAGPHIIAERIIDTLLGASIGLVSAIMLSTVDDRRHLAGLRNA